MDQTQGRLNRRQLLGLRLAGAGLLLATGAIHLDLYLTGYRSLPTIGWLFLLQVIAAFGIGVAVLATGSRLAAAAGAGFALATLGGYVLTVWVGLFGFKEIRTTAGIVAGIIEIAAFAALAAVALAAAPRPAAAGAAPAGGGSAAGSAVPRSAMLGRLQAGGMPGAGRAAAGVAALALVLLVVAVATAGGAKPVTAGGTLRTAKIHGATVLTNAKGLTLYWFVPDTSTKSVCNGTCAAYWPPVAGTPTAGPGVAGHIGTIKRADGSTQATYNGHPLYTYAGDSGPGQANGNNITLNGGLWHEVLASG